MIDRAARAASTRLVCVALLVAAPVFAQVREMPVAFDPAGRIMVVTRAIADSLQLAPPSWPVTGEFTEARLHRQEGAGYIVIVTRRDGAMERFSIPLEQLEAIRARFGAAPPAIQPEPTPTAAEPRVVAPEPPARPNDGGRSLANGQVLLASTVYGPAIGNSMRAIIDDPLAVYAAWFGTIGATLYIARKEMDRHPSMAQSIMANHGGLHGAGLGAALVRALGAASPSDSGVNAHYTSAIFAGGVAGALLGYTSGKRMTQTQATASAFFADVGLLVSTAALLSAGKLDTTLESASAAVLVGGTVAGYLLGPRYARRDSTITPGDVVALASPGVVGALLAATIVEASGGDGEEGANVIAGGLLGGLAAGHYLLARPTDHTFEQASLLLGATAAGAYIGAGIGGLDEGASAARVLTIATITAGAAIWLMERRFAMDRPAHGLRRPAGRRSGWSFSAAALGVAAARVPGVHPVLSYTR